MMVFIYQAAMWCEDCGRKIQQQRLREIKIPLKEFLQRVGKWEFWNLPGWEKSHVGMIYVRNTAL